MNETPVIEIEGVEAGYGGDLILRNLTLRVTKGECVGIAGPNGIGKTTLFKVILGRLKPWKGKITVLGRSLDKNKDRRWVRRQIGYVPQQSSPGRLPVSVFDAVMMGRWGKGFTWWQRPGRNDRRITVETLRRVGLEHKKESDCRCLSGGEGQKVAIARALVREASILLLDEPTTYLDFNSSQELLSLIKRLKEERGLTLIVISHDPLHLKELADRRYELSGGLLREIT